MEVIQQILNGGRTVSSTPPEPQKGARQMCSAIVGKRAHAQGKGVYRILLSVTIALITLSVGVNSFGQALLNPNQIKGVIEFTNTNPAILEILSRSGGDEGFRSAYIYANSIGVSPPLNNYSFSYADTGTSIGYELTVESSEEGIPYRVMVYSYLEDWGDLYVFSDLESAPVFPEPSADVSLDFRQCAGLLTFTSLVPTALRFP